MSDQPGWDPAQGGFQPPRPGPPPQQPAPYPQPSSEPNYPPSQPYQAPPGQPYQQAPGQYGTAAPRKRRKWPWILGGIVLLFFVLIGGCTLFVFNLARGPIDGANEWIAVLDEGDFAGAQSTMCRSSATEPASLVADFGAGIDDYNLNSVNSTNGSTSVDGTVTIGGRARGITLFMANQDGNWRVCDYLLL